MFENMTETQARAEILKSVAEYYHAYKEKKVPFQEGDRITYAAQMCIRDSLLSGQIGVTYKTAWSMLRRIRSAMGQRDAAYILSGVVELDDACFGGPKVGGKRDRGTEKTKIFIALSLDEHGNLQYLKMRITRISSKPL